MPGNCIFSGPMIYLLSMCSDDNPFTCQCEKEGKQAQGFQVSHFYWLFSSDIMAVKGLISVLAQKEREGEGEGVIKGARVVHFKVLS